MTIYQWFKKLAKHKKSGSFEFELVPKNELIGKKYGEYENEKNILSVSPAVYSLFESDFDLMLNNLKIAKKETSEDI